MNQINANQANHNFEAFAELPVEVSEEIFSVMDLSTLFNTSHAFCGNSYEIGNKVADKILEQRFIIVHNKGDSPLKQLWERLTSYCEFTKKFCPEKTMTINLFDNVKKLEEGVKEHPELLETYAENLLYLRRYDGQEEHIQLFVEAGGIINLTECIFYSFSPKFIEKILIRNCFKGEIGLSHLWYAFDKQHPDNILAALLSKWMETKLSCTIGGGWWNDHVTSKILYSKLPEPLVICFINRMNNLKINNLCSFMHSCKLSENILLALIDRIDRSNLDSDEVENYLDALWYKVFEEKTYSVKPLIKFLGICTEANIEFKFF